MVSSISRLLDFGMVGMRKNASLIIHMCNNRMVPEHFKIYISGPFAIPTERLYIESKSYVAFPIAFVPTQRGVFKEFLVIKGDMGKSERSC